MRASEQNLGPHYVRSNRFDILMTLDDWYLYLSFWIIALDDGWLTLIRRRRRRRHFTSTLNSSFELVMFDNGQSRKVWDSKEHKWRKDNQKPDLPMATGNGNR